MAAVRAYPIWLRLATVPTVMRPAMSSERTTGRAFMRPSCRHPTGFRKSGNYTGLNLEDPSDMPRSRFCRRDGHAASIARAHHVRPRSQPPSRHVARHQPAAGGHEDLQHELRVLSVRMDAWSGPLLCAGAELSH